MHTAEIQNSLCIHAIWSEFSLSTWRSVGCCATHRTCSKDWLEYVDVQADLSLFWLHIWFCRFYCLPAHFIWARARQNQQNDLCTQQTQISLVSLAVWSESSLGSQRVDKDAKLLYADNKDTDQTGWMPRLIWVFAGCISHFVGFVMLWLNSHLVFNRKKVYSLIDKSGNFIENRTGKSKNFILNFYLIFVPMMEGHIAFGLSVHPSFSLSRFLMHARVLNFHNMDFSWKIADLYFFLVRVMSFYGVMPLWKN